MSTMQAASEWLAASRLTDFIASRFWIIPTLQSIHILCVGIVTASIGMLDLRLAGVIGREQSLREMTLRFYPWIWGALAVLLVTGILQVMGEPPRELRNWIFWAKMALIVAAVLVTMPIRSLLEDRPFRELSPGKRTIIRACAVLSLLLWVAVVSCGRWIAYAGSDAF